MQIFRSHATDKICEAQEFEASLRHARGNVGHLGCHILPHRTGGKLHRKTDPDKVPLHFLQLQLSHLLVDGVVLHPLHRHGSPLRQDIQRHQSQGQKGCSPEEDQVGLWQEHLGEDSERQDVPKSFSAGEPLHWQCGRVGRRRSQCEQTLRSHRQQERSRNVPRRQFVQRGTLRAFQVSI